MERIEAKLEGEKNRASRRMLCYTQLKKKLNKSLNRIKWVGIVKLQVQDMLTGGRKQAHLSFHEKAIAALTGVAQGVGVDLQSERSPVLFLVRVHGWVVGSVPSRGRYERQTTDVSLSHRCFSPSLCPSLTIHK